MISEGRATSVEELAGWAVGWVGRRRRGQVVFAGTHSEGREQGHLFTIVSMIIQNNGERGDLRLAGLTGCRTVSSMRDSRGDVWTEFTRLHLKHSIIY